MEKGKWVLVICLALSETLESRNVNNGHMAENNSTTFSKSLD